MLQKYNEICVIPRQDLTQKKPFFKRDIGSVESYNTVRPILSMSRFETGKFCSFWQLPIYPDASNQKVKFFRNRIRRQLLPTIKLFFNPKIEKTLLQFAEIVEAEDRCMSQVAKNVSTVCVPSFSLAPQGRSNGKRSKATPNRPNKVWISLLQNQAFNKNESLLLDGFNLRPAKILSVFPPYFSWFHLSSQTFPLLPSVCKGLLETNASSFRCLPSEEEQLSEGSKPKDSGSAFHCFFRRRRKLGKHSFRSSGRSKLKARVTTQLPSPTEEAMECRGMLSKQDVRGNTLISSPLVFFPRSSVPLGISFWLGSKRVCTIKKLGLAFGKYSLNAFLRSKPFGYFGTKQRFASQERTHHTRIFSNSNLGLECRLLNTSAKASCYNIISSMMSWTKLQHASSPPLCTTFGGTAKGTKIQVNTLELNKVISHQRYAKEIEHVFIRHFFTYFDTLKIEKKDMYWPLVISFLPTALQRRIVKLFLLNQNWKKIQYSQVENFITKKTIH